jgi:hypothetical protein
MTTREQWAVDFLTGRGFQASDNNIKSVVCWIASENSNAQFNPLDTTEQWNASTDYNSAGVKNYANYEDGLSATWATLFNGLYQPIIDALASSASPAETTSHISNSPWGSKPTPELVATVLTDYQQYASVLIPGTTTNDGNGGHPMTVIPDGTVEPGGDAPAEVPAQDKVEAAAGGILLEAPIVAGWPTKSESGYTAVAADGGVFCKGDAVFHGSMAGRKLAAPVVDGWAVTNGYVLLAEDGATFIFSEGSVVGEGAV